MKKIFFTSFLAFTLFVCCNKENGVVTEFKEVSKDVDIKKFSDVQLLEYFSKIEFKNFELHSFVIKSINDKNLSKGQKADFSKDKIDYNVRVRFTDKRKFFGITDNKIEISDAKKDGFFSTNDSSVYISGYFKDGRFYFEKVNKLGF